MIFWKNHIGGGGIAPLAVLGLMPEMMKLLGNTKSKIDKDTNSENVSLLETILVHFNIDKKKLLPEFESFVYICSY